MYFNSTGHITATDVPELKDRSDLDVTVFRTSPADGISSADSIHINGTRAERAAFLRDLADAANNAADELLSDAVLTSW